MALSAIDLARGKLLWSLGGLSMLYAGEELDPSSTLLGFAEIIFLNGFLDGEYALWAIDISRGGKVAWRGSSVYSAVGGGYVLTRSGHLHEARSGQIRWQIDPCEKALIDPGYGEVLCLRRHVTPRRKLREPNRCRRFFSRHRLEDGSLIDERRWLGECSRQPLVEAGGRHILVAARFPGRETTLLVDPQGQATPLPCQGVFHVHHATRTALCRIASGDALRLNLDTGVHWLIEGFELEPPSDPIRLTSSAGRPPIGWSNRHRAPAEYRLGEGLVPLLAPRRLRASKVDIGWPGSRDRAYILTTDDRLLCLDRKRRAILWSSSELGAVAGLDPSVIDTGKYAALIAAEGRILVFDPHTGSLRSRIDASLSGITSEGASKSPSRIGNADGARSARR